MKDVNLIELDLAESVAKLNPKTKEALDLYNSTLCKLLDAKQDISKLERQLNTTSGAEYARTQEILYRRRLAVDNLMKQLHDNHVHLTRVCNKTFSTADISANYVNRRLV